MVHSSLCKFPLSPSINLFPVPINSPFKLHLPTRSVPDCIFAYPCKTLQHSSVWSPVADPACPRPACLVESPEIASVFCPRPQILPSHFLVPVCLSLWLLDVTSRLPDHPAIPEHPSACSVTVFLPRWLPTRFQTPCSSSPYSSPTYSPSPVSPFPSSLDLTILFCAWIHVPWQRI